MAPLALGYVVRPLRGQELWVKLRGLGDYFLDSLFSDIDSLCLYAGMHAVRFGYHRLLSKRFPFAVYYTVEGETVNVWAVLDCRQDPAKIEERLTDARTR